MYPTATRISSRTGAQLTKAGDGTRRAICATLEYAQTSCMTTKDISHIRTAGPVQRKEWRNSTQRADSTSPSQRKGGFGSSYFSMSRTGLQLETCGTTYPHQLTSRGTPRLSHPKAR